MSSRYSSGNRDKNEPLITEIIKRFHVPYITLSEGQGADLLLLTNPPAFVEVKNPEQPPNKRKLTDTEKATQEICKEKGIAYYVVLYSDQISDILSRYFMAGGK